jgi:hypothetical protein
MAGWLKSLASSVPRHRPVESSGAVPGLSAAPSQLPPAVPHVMTPKKQERDRGVT